MIQLPKSSVLINNRARLLKEDNVKSVSNIYFETRFWIILLIKYKFMFKKNIVNRYIILDFKLNAAEKYLLRILGYAISEYPNSDENFNQIVFTKILF